ncbi:hypothetical protein [Neorhizobium sp. DT-125]|uniref:hypothetical protein n=1 Tax=Neorhizobium sp. DT-125 TaxID=3396163 RepID=UPI003F1C1997
MRKVIFLVLAAALASSSAYAQSSGRGSYYQGVNRDETPAETAAARRYHESRYGMTDPTRTGSIGRYRSDPAFDSGDYYVGVQRPD